jgi:hypothetical protein
MSLKRLSSWGLVVLLLMALTATVSAQMTPSVTVSDQSIEGGTVTVDNVVSDGPGWIVIHADEDGSPGAVIGHSAVADGENMDVEVEIDTMQATETLYAMLHTDAGTEGTYEFPDDDMPAQVDGEVVVAAFTVTGGMEEGAGGAAEEQPETMPEAGGIPTPWYMVLLVAGALAVGMGLGLSLARRPR